MTSSPKMRALKHSCIIIAVLLLSAYSVVAQLNETQARRLIARVAGAELPTKAVRIKRISNGNAPAATAEIETAFRFGQNADAQWVVSEVRVAPDVWEDINLIREALGVQSTGESCTAAEPGPEGVLSVRRARCLIAALFHIVLPSDDVRIKSVSAINVPLATSPSATVVANLTVHFRFAAQNRGALQIVSIRSGSADWVDVPQVSSNLEQLKRSRALSELQTVASALGEFRVSRGYYVATDNHTVLVDFLSPRYLSRVIRVDPWHSPYEYVGEHDRFTLRSAGPDRKTNTPDDLVVSQP